MKLTVRERRSQKSYDTVCGLGKGRGGGKWLLRQSSESAIRDRGVYGARYFVKDG